MADNIDIGEEELDNPASTQSENLSGEIISDNNTNTPKQETENMEVHHHPDLHHKPKPWKEYFLEFLMIFLAVTMGFIAENIREHIDDKEKEKQAIKSLVNCLASDTLQLKSIINSNIKLIKNLDNLTTLKKTGFRSEEGERKFLTYSSIGFIEDWYFKTNDAAFQQLKSSGLLRLIHKQSITDSIFKYDLKNRVTTSAEADSYSFWKECLDDFRKTVDLTYFKDSDVVQFNSEDNFITMVIKNPASLPISNNKEDINKLFSNATVLADTESFYVGTMKDQLAYGKTLITFLKNEYNLD
jgi:hypothetical protein